MRNIDPQEWEVRCDLAAAYRLIAHFGMDDLIFTHLSARLPGNEHRFLLNPYGLMFDEITASSLVDGRSRWPCDRAGRGVQDQQRGLHDPFGRAYGARDGALRDAYPHDAGMAVAAQDRGCCRSTRCRWRSSAGRLPRLRGHRARPRRARAAGARPRRKDVMILKHHGLLTVGRTVAEAFLNMYYMEQSCRSRSPPRKAARRSRCRPTRSPPIRRSSSTATPKPRASAPGPPCAAGSIVRIRATRRKANPGSSLAGMGRLNVFDGAVFRFADD